MKFIITLAFKNLTRYKRRTMITAMAIAYGMFLYVIMDSTLVGLEKETERNLFWYETSMARVQHTDYQEEAKLLPLTYTIKNPDKIIGQLIEQGVKTAPRIDFKGEAIVYKDPYPEDGNLPVRGIGIDLTRDEDVYKIKKDGFKEGKGRYLEPGDQGVILGSRLAQNLGAEVGYPLLVQTRTKYGAVQTIDTEVVGIFEVDNPLLNTSTFFMTIEMADDYLEMEGEVTSISLAFKESLDADQKSAEIKQALLDSPKSDTELDVVSWTKLAADYVAVAGAKKGGSSVMILLIMIIALIGISNTMLMAAYERVHELSMMRALGMSDSRIKLSFLLEAAGIGLIGSAAALALSVGANALLVKYGLNFFAIFDVDISQFNMGYRTAGKVYGVWKLSSYITVVVVGLIVPMLVALLPANKSMKMKIAEGLREGVQR